MKREVKLTNDGSKTLFISEMNEGYHSGHGALQEAIYVFIKNGLNAVENSKISILELGFGTGLNVLVTIDEFLKKNNDTIIHYFTIEKYPVKMEEVKVLDYPSLFENPLMKDINDKIHECQWGEAVEIVPNFFLTKLEADFYEIKNMNLPPIDLVYFDCFGARVQPDLWERPLLEIVVEKMEKGALFTTYSSKGTMRRALQELGLEVAKKPGPPGKREMINAVKI